MDFNYIFYWVYTKQKKYGITQGLANASAVMGIVFVLFLLDIRIVLLLFGIDIEVSYTKISSYIFGGIIIVIMIIYYSYKKRYMKIEEGFQKMEAGKVFKIRTKISIILIFMVLLMLLGSPIAHRICQ